MKTKTFKIEPDVADVLRDRLSYDGNKVRIGGERLAADLYRAVNKVLIQFGGKWTAGKVQAHVFPECPQRAIAEAIGTGKVVNVKQTFQFFETPANIADRMIELARIDMEKGGDFLEPSAGNGAIIAALFRLDSLFGFSLDAIDIDPVRCRYIRDNFLTLNVHEQDFLAFSSKKYDHIFMNPPFTGGQDADHVMHAHSLLKPGGRLVAIVGEGICTRTDKKAVAFQYFVQEHLSNEEKLDAGTFAESGTKTPSRIIVLEYA